MQNNPAHINYGFYNGEERPPVQMAGNPPPYYPTVPLYHNVVPAPTIATAPPINTQYIITSGHPIQTTATRKGVSKVRCLCITAAVIFPLIVVAVAAVLVWYFVAGVGMLGQKCGQSSTCIGSSQWCDGQTDCPGGEDEAQCLRFYGPNFMLQSFSNSDQKWKAVCSDRWSDTIGKQACQQIGYSASDYVSYGTTNPGSSAADGYMALSSIYSNALGLGSVHSFLLNSTSCPSNTAVTLKCIDCGSSSAPAARIIGGTVVSSLGRWPWQVSLQVNGHHLCGGSVITPSWIVTAAHCVQIYSSPSQWTVYAGYLTLAQMASGSLVSTVISHPNYNADTNNYDIALMKLWTPLKMSNNIRPVCLPNTGLDFSTSRTYYVTGWGTTVMQGSASNELREAQISLISQAVCNSSQVYNGQLTNTMICAGNLAGGVDSCQGDSGGPLVTSQNFLWWLVGDTSWGHGCALRNRPGIYGNMTVFVDWIYTQMKMPSRGEYICYLFVPISRCATSLAG
ncbi:transmembrane protease serine 2 [Tachysurus ichikawai]